MSVIKIRESFWLVSLKQSIACLTWISSQMKGWLSLLQTLRYYIFGTSNEKITINGSKCCTSIVSICTGNITVICECEWTKCWLFELIINHVGSIHLRKNLSKPVYSNVSMYFKNNHENLFMFSDSIFKKGTRKSVYLPARIYFKAMLERLSWVLLLHNYHYPNYFSGSISEHRLNIVLFG